MVLSALKKLITENVYDIKPSPGLFFNEKGPTNGPGSDQIYIDCQPVGQSEEEDIVITDSGSGSSADSITAENIMQNKYFQMLLGAILFIAIIYLVKFITDIWKPKDVANVAKMMGGSKKMWK
jgi:hypothetical protein